MTVDEGPRLTGATRDYEILELLERRGMAWLYRARRRRMAQDALLTFVPADGFADSAGLERVVADCRRAAALQHPHITSPFELWHDAEGVYAAAPLPIGGTLDRSLAQGPWEADAVLHVIDQLGAALAYAHRRGVSHGGVDPANVALDDEGNGYLDFGLTLGDRSRGAAGDIEGLAILTCRLLTGATPAEAHFTAVELPAGFGQLMRRATDPDPQRRFESVDAYLESLHQAFTDRAAAPPTASLRNPYKGFRPFHEADAVDYFGRDHLVDELLALVSASTLCAVVGPSGSGRTSLVHAGLIPALRRGRAAIGGAASIVSMTAGRRPFEALEAALSTLASDLVATAGRSSIDGRALTQAAARVGADGGALVVVIDGFEDLFGPDVPATTRDDFIAALVEGATDRATPLRVVLIVRSDTAALVRTHEMLGPLVAGSILTVTPPDESQLTEAVAEPARRVGLGLEAGLVTTIAREVVHEPGALAWMQHCLAGLAERATESVLTTAEHLRAGGVAGALVALAEQTFVGLSPAARDAARAVFVRLVAVRPDAHDAGRRVARAELDALEVEPERLSAVIETFANARLLVFDSDPATGGPTVELAHEALVREWPRYRTWIDERRRDLPLQRRLATSMAEWRAGEHDPQYLASGSVLRAYEQWIDSSPVRLTTEERAYLDASRDEEQRRSQAATRRRRLVLAALGGLAGVALVASLVALDQRRRTDDARRDAAVAAQVADAAATAAQQTAAIDEAQALVSRAATLHDPDLRLLLTLEAHQIVRAVGREDPTVTSALYQYGLDHRVDLRVPRTHDLVTIDAALDGDVAVATAVFEPMASVIDLATGAVRAEYESPVDAFGSAWLADERLVATGLVDGTVHLWDETGRLVTSVEASNFPVRPLFAVGGQLVVAQYASARPGLFRIIAFDGIGGAEVLRTDQVVVSAAASPTGGALMVVEVDGTVRIYDTASWQEETSGVLARTLAGVEVLAAAWSDSGNEIWVLTDERLRLLHTLTGAEVASFDPEILDPGFVEVSVDGALLAVGGAGEPVNVFDSSNGERLAVIEGSVGPLSDQRSFAARGRSVGWTSNQRLVVSTPGAVVVWDFADPDADAAVWPPGAGAPVLTHVTADGRLLLGSDRGEVEIVDPDGAVTGVLGARGITGAPPVVSADDATVVLPGGDAIEVVRLADPGVPVFVGPEGLPRPLALSGDAQLVIVGTERTSTDVDHTVMALDTATGEVRWRLGTRLEGEPGVLTSDDAVAVIPVARIVNETALPNSSLWLVDAATGEVLGLGPPQTCIRSVALSDDDALAATVGCDGNVSLFDMAALLGARPWEARLGGNLDDTVAGVGAAFAPDGTVIVARVDGRVEAFEADADFERVWAFDVGRHAGAPFVADGRVWVGALRGVGDAASGGAIALPLAIDDLVSFAGARVTRTLTDAECREYLDIAACPVR